MTTSKAEGTATGPKTSRTKPGFVESSFVGKFIHISADSWAKITAHLDLNCLDEQKWLTKQLQTIADNLK